ncbi:MAG: twin-arginine translocase subunit TatC [Chloroflexi bacterium]|nr:twin-arginine translocase subunit TatC [Chloroflexota bacterium]
MTIPIDEQRYQPSSPPTENGALHPEALADPVAAAVASGEAGQTATSQLAATTMTVPYEPAQPPAAPPPTTSLPPAASDDEPEEEGMTMLEHLEELRVRIIVCAVSLAVGLVVAAVPIPFLTQGSVTQTVMEMVAEPARCCLIYVRPGEGFITYFQVALIIGAALALPMITYQVIAFVLPALLPHEKKYLFMAVPGAMASFVCGLLFGYVLLLPAAITFLLNWNPTGFVEVKWAFGEYMSTVTTLLFYMGLAFETPLLMFFLAKLRILNPHRLSRFRKYALILSFVVGAVITPTPDPLNQTLVSLPLYLLFELGLLLAKLA